MQPTASLGERIKVGVIRHGDEKVGILWVEPIGCQRPDERDPQHPREFAHGTNEIQNLGDKVESNIDQLLGLPLFFPLFIEGIFDQLDLLGLQPFAYSRFKPRTA